MRAYRSFIAVGLALTLAQALSLGATGEERSLEATAVDVGAGADGSV